LKGKAGAEAGSIKNVLAHSLQISPQLLEDCLLRVGIEPTATLASTRLVISSYHHFMHMPLFLFLFV
jgi:hypothetical protein